ncbi:unnamed protein product [Rhizoctonia solani]|nr:unnamed protein product [Rhizoctonia solani]
MSKQRFSLFDDDEDEVPPTPIPATFPTLFSPPYTHEPTFAQMMYELNKSTEISLDLSDAMQAFKAFLEVEENIAVCKCQLRVLRRQAVSVLEECALYKREGGDLSEALPVITQALIEVSAQLKSKARWHLFLQDSFEMNEVEVLIGRATRKLADQLQKSTGGGRSIPQLLIYKTVLEGARENDRRTVEHMDLAIRTQQNISPNHDLCEIIRHSMKRLLNQINSEVSAVDAGQQVTDATKALAAIAELTRQSLPSYNMLNERFVRAGNHAISQGAGYDVFLGDYFTGQPVAIKVLKHRVDEKTARQTHARLERHLADWIALRHENILPLYGIGIMQPRISSSASEYQLYFVSPYLKNQDVKRYIRKNPKISGSSRLQIILDIAQGLEYMHCEYLSSLPDKQGMAHTALNTSNVLIKDSGRAVISGFGHPSLLREFQVTPIMDGSEYRYMVLTDEPPFGSKTRGTRIIRMIGTGKRPQRSDHAKIEEYPHANEIWQLFEDCWNNEPDDRPGATKLVQSLKALVTMPINRNMSATEIVRLLSERGYSDVTAAIDVDQCSSAPMNHGGAGDIYQGYLTSGIKVAIKCPRKFNTFEDEGREALKAIAKEGYQWSKHRHVNVLEIFGLALFRNQIALVSPWMENGTALDYVKKRPGVDRLDLCSQVACGLAYLHNQETINVLVSKEGIAKIIDFGSTVMNYYSLQFSGGENVHHFTMRWAAPECLEGDDALVSKPSDVYALAMVKYGIGDKQGSNLKVSALFVDYPWYD